MKASRSEFAASHPWRKNNDAPRMGHPQFDGGAEVGHALEGCDLLGWTVGVRSIPPISR